MLEDPRLSRNNVRVPRRDNYEKRPVLSATIHPDLKRTLVTMSERTGLSIRQVTDEVLYAGLVEMQELDEIAERGVAGSAYRPPEERTPRPLILKVLSPTFAYKLPHMVHQTDTTV
jgi:hypothetical protein